MTVESVASRNARIRKELNGLIRTFGSLELRLSGEGKISFLGVADGAYVGYIHQIFDGDTGCMVPLPMYDESALDHAFNFLKSLSPGEHLNDDENLDYVLHVDGWKRELEKFRNYIRENPNLTRYDYDIKKEVNGENVVVVTIKLEPVINRYVSAEYTSSKSGELVGIVKHTKVFSIKDHSMTSPVWDAELEIYPFDHDATEKLDLSNDNTCVFRHVVPGEGDFILRDAPSGKYVVLPKIDYPGAFH